MTWTKLDDQFWSNTKVLRAGDEAAGTYARLLSYAGFLSDDGKIPAEGALMVAGGSRKKLDKLIEIGLLHELHDGRFHIPDYLEYNISADEMEGRRAEYARRGKRGAQSRWGNSDSNGKSHG